MKIIFILILTLTSTFCNQQDPYVQLQKLNGVWKMETAKGPLYESWTKTSANEMRGGSFKTIGNDTIRFEDVRLSKSDQGIYYSPIVKNENGDKPVSFRMISSTDQRFVFENKEHDFPQRIIYHLIARDSMHAWIEGIQNGKEKTTDYYFKKIQ
jgi:hypothetical protein